MISQLANKHADKCRFCWMCRHLCPVQLQTGKEVNTPRAKGLMLSNVARGKEFDEDMAKVMYECVLCDACQNDCATGYQPPLFIREARTEAVVEGIAPKAVMDLIDTVDKTGTIYGEEKPSYGNGVASETLLYIGEVAAVKNSNMVNALINLLHKAGITYTILENEPASGVMEADLMGYVEEVRQRAKVCAQAINDSGAKIVIVVDSYDAEIMKQKYPEWGCEIQAEVVSALSYISNLIKTGSLTVVKKQNGTAAYHDDDRSARTFHEFEPGRAILKELGYEYTEMFNKYELAKSCGCSVAKAYMPQIVKQMAAGRWDDFLRTKADVMLVANPESYECLEMAIPEGKKLIDIYEVLDKVTE